MEKEAQGIGLYNTEAYNFLLRNYIKEKFAQYNPKQLLLFGLEMDDLVESLVDKVTSIPVQVEWTNDPKEHPHGVFHVDDNGKLSIFIGGVDHKKYHSESKRQEKYIEYVESVLFHELIHAVHYLIKPWQEVGYGPFRRRRRVLRRPRRSKLVLRSNETLFTGTKT